MSVGHGGKNCFKECVSRRCHFANSKAVCSRNNQKAHMAESDVNNVTRLTDREREVAALVCNGLPSKTVAQKLNVSEGTVKTHLHHIFQKLGVRGRSELPVALLSVRRSTRL
jgi:two-component system nitrate/nitrite response regulator NarL